MRPPFWDVARRWLWHHVVGKPEAHLERSLLVDGAPKDYGLALALCHCLPGWTGPE